MNRRRATPFINFGLLWLRSKCAESSIYQLFPYVLFMTDACPKINFVFISRLTGKCATQCTLGQRSNWRWANDEWYIRIWESVKQLWITRCRVMRYSRLCTLFIIVNKQTRHNFNYLYGLHRDIFRQWQNTIISRSPNFFLHMPGHINHAVFATQ